MSYSKRDDIPVQAGEQAVELDDGALVAVRCVQSIDGSRLRFHATARAIDAAGAAVVDAAGTPVARELQHSDPDTTRATAVARDCLLAVLGEPPATVQWGAQYLLDVSIRQALALANIHPGAADAAALL
ncbi:hypothetical protein [Stenotrophomonas sp. MMGLT7]|uniref:hypothetical protein n=1 Tax=Stenotrophomonas sp. MMGLT7 TaxID=2901227 RepID=UPI001E2D4AF9|nr:hypothetical protein [Stenotrophomonas sp. MMGLT7]MCD7096928.1 hypothetical protein [Stenotrophomonas sp. MMGLT7]